MRKMLVMLLVSASLVRADVNNWVINPHELRIRPNFIWQENKPLCWAASAALLLRLSGVPASMRDVAALGPDATCLGEWHTIKGHQFRITRIPPQVNGHYFYQALARELRTHLGFFLEEMSYETGRIGDHSVVAVGMKVTDGVLENIAVVDSNFTSYQLRMYEGSKYTDHLEKNCYAIEFQ